MIIVLNNSVKFNNKFTMYIKITMKDFKILEMLIIKEMMMEIVKRRVSILLQIKNMNIVMMTVTIFMV